MTKKKRVFLRREKESFFLRREEKRKLAKSGNENGVPQSCENPSISLECTYQINLLFTVKYKSKINQLEI